MADPCDSNIRIASVTYNGVLQGVCKSFSWEAVKDDITIPGDGKATPSCRPIVRRDLIAIVDLLTTPITTDDTLNANLVIACEQSDGGTTTYTLGNMAPRGYSYQLDRGAPPGLYRQRYVLVGDPSGDNVTIS